MILRWVRCGSFALLALGVCLGGCGRNAATSGGSEILEPLIRKAKSKSDQGDRAGALECLNQALKKRPDLAQAHLDAGLLYDDYQKDYVRAVYHYQRYLELRPASDKKDMIEEMIRKARLSFAASVADQLPDVSEKYKTLQEENLRLKNDLRAARETPAARPAASVLPGPALAGAASAAPAATPAGGARPAAPAVEIYRVQEHETLSMIASKVYQQPGKWQAIFEANRQTLASPEKLRPGQALIIPR